MPKRPRSHQIESEARGKIKEVFDIDYGWSVEDLHQDYGEDLLVRIFQQRKATPFSFYVQSKSTDSINRFRKRNSKLTISLSKTHVRHWVKFGEPVFVTLYDSKSGKTFWECIQIFAETKAGKRRLASTTKTITVDLPEANTLDRYGVRRIFNITKERCLRHHYNSKGVEILLSLFEERAKIKIEEYDFQRGVLLLKHKKGSSEIILFGHTKELWNLITAHRKVSFNKLLCDYADSFFKSFKHDKKTGKVTITSEEGRSLSTYNSLEDWHFSHRVEEELRDREKETRIARKTRRLILEQKKQKKKFI